MPPPAPVKPPPVEPASQPKPLDIPRPEAETSKGRSVPIWTIIAGGAALAAAGAGIGLYLASESAYEEYSSKDPAPSPTRWAELKDEIPKLDMGATISFAVSGALAATAVVLFILVDRPAMKERKAAVSAVRVGPGGFAFSFDF